MKIFKKSSYVVTMLLVLMLIVVGCSTEKAPDESSDEPIEGIHAYIGTFNEVDLAVASDEGTESIIHRLSDTEQEEFEAILQIDTWVEATDLPARGFHAELIASNSELDIMFINAYDQDNTVILLKGGIDVSSSIAYYAPLQVAIDIIEFKENLQNN